MVCCRFLFGGAIPHYFFSFLEYFARKKFCCSLFWQLLLERVVYMPFFQFFQLYMLSLLEGKSHLASLNSSLMLLLKVVNANWKYITVLQIINLKFVPPMVSINMYKHLLLVLLCTFCSLSKLLTVRLLRVHQGRCNHNNQKAEDLNHISPYRRSSVPGCKYLHFNYK